MSYLGKKVTGSNIVIKLDMAKAFDRVSWVFLTKVLWRFGFYEVFIDLIWRIISGNWFSVLINGAPTGYFSSSRGLRQGDPLSPSLFIIASEVLSRSLNQLHSSMPSVTYSTSSGCPVISHLAFADDVVICCNGHRRSLCKHTKLLSAYARSSGQAINASKSSFYVARSTLHTRVLDIAALLGYWVGTLPIAYLGYPLYFGRKKKQFFDPLVAKIQNRIDTWMGVLLNPPGHLTLIKHVLHSISAYQLASLDPLFL